MDDAPNLQVSPDDLTAAASLLNSASAALDAADLDISPDAGESTSRLLSIVNETAVGIAGMAQHLTQLAANAEAVRDEFTATDQGVGATLDEHRRGLGR